MTTIVITHDLSQISSEDFVHVLKDGRLVEQGFRHELESFASEFSTMARTQDADGGFQEKDTEETDADDLPIEAILEKQDEEKQEELEAVKMSTTALRHHSITPSTFRPLTLGNWMFDAIAELTKNPPAPAVSAQRESRPVSRFIPASAFTGATADVDEKALRRRTLHIDVPAASVSVPAPLPSANSNRFSLQFTPTSPTLCSSPRSFAPSMVEDDLAFEKDKAAMQRSATLASQRRSHDHKRQRTREVRLDSVIVEKAEENESASQEAPASQEAEISFFRLLRDIYPTLPNKPLILLGIAVCIASGTVTPVFSYLLSRLFFEVSNGARDVSIINVYGGIVLAIAAADGLLIGLKISIMENAAMHWVTRIRNVCYQRVLAQDKKWFDKAENAPVRLVQILIKDGDDARSLIASVLGQSLVVSAMLGVGLIWALVRGWQLTLVGFAIAPVFAGVMALQSNLVAKCEVRNKRAREEVAKQYYDVSRFPLSALFSRADNLL